MRLFVIAVIRKRDLFRNAGNQHPAVIFTVSFGIYIDSSLLILYFIRKILTELDNNPR